VFRSPHRHHGDVDVDDLYGLPPDRFVPGRAAVTRELRAAGRREEAAVVARLPKPSVAAWAVNQLVRSQARAIASLFEAGQGLRDAQSEVLAGRGGGPALRAAAERERTAVDALVKAARGLLTSDGHEPSAATLDRVGETLHAAAVDDDAQQLVRDGRLERELLHVGFGLGDAAVAPARRATSARRKRVPDGVARARGAATRARDSSDNRERIARERAESQRAERDRAKARKAAHAFEADARRHFTRAARAVALAEERRERAQSAMRDADEALAAARAEADAAAAAHRNAQEQLNSV
jgi:hypothetical protein